MSATIDEAKDVGHWNLGANVSNGAFPRTVSVIIPALNEEDSLGDLLVQIAASAPELRSAGVIDWEVIVVDDGSTDRTADIAAALGAQTISHPRTLGYGAALKSGFRHSRGELLAFLDADGTYPIQDLPRLCRLAAETDADIVVGSRRSGDRSAMPVVRRLGNAFWATLITVLTGRGCSDPASGMRVFRRRLTPLLPTLPDGLHFTPIMTMKALYEGRVILETPIPYFERIGKSKLNVVTDGFRFLGSILSTACGCRPGRILQLGVCLGVITCVGLSVAWAVLYR